MPFGNISETSFFLPRMAGLLMGGGTGFDQAAKGMGAMPFMTPEQAQQMMQSPGVRQMLQAYGLAPTENIRQSPFFSNQSFLGRHPRLGGAITGSLENMAMTPQPTGPEGFGGGMQRFAQGLAGGPEMQRQYLTKQILAPMQALGMMMPATGGQIFRQLVQHVMGGQDTALQLRQLEDEHKMQMANLKEQNRNLVAQGRLTLDQAKLTEKQLADRQSNEAKMANAQAAATRAQADLVKAQTAAQTLANKGQFVEARAKLDSWKTKAYSDVEKEVDAAVKAGTPLSPQEIQNRKQTIENSYASSMGILAGREIKPYQYPAIAPGGQQTKGAGGEPPRPANVPEGYVFNSNGPKGAGWYNPKSQ